MRPQVIFVFGSNLAGRHGAGAALAARRFHGAIYGQGEGFQGSSYAIPTKDGRDRSIPLSDPRQRLPLAAIEQAVTRFVAFAAANPQFRFKVTAIGCGLAAYTAHQIAPYFASAPSNCDLPPEFVNLLASGSAA